MITGPLMGELDCMVELEILKQQKGEKMRFTIVVSISIAEDGCQQWEGVHVERVISASSVGLLFAGEAWAEFLKKLSEIPNTLPPTG